MQHLKTRNFPFVLHICLDKLTWNIKLDCYQYKPWVPGVKQLNDTHFYFVLLFHTAKTASFFPPFIHYCTSFIKASLWWLKDAELYYFRGSILLSNQRVWKSVMCCLFLAMLCSNSYISYVTNHPKDLFAKSEWLNNGS